MTEQRNKYKNIISVLFNIGIYDFFNQKCEDIISYSLTERFQRNWWKNVCLIVWYCNCTIEFNHGGCENSYGQETQLRGVSTAEIVGWILLSLPSLFPKNSYWARHTFLYAPASVGPDCF